MKQYEPEQMIKSSRFRELYQKSDTKTRTKVLEEITDLVAAEPDYADEKNYGHLSNLFTAMAFCRTYESMGMTRKSSVKYVEKAMFKALKNRRKRMKKHSRNPLFITFIKAAVPVEFSLTAGYGWEISYPKAGKECFSIITTKCIYADLLNKHEMPELISSFCHVDDMLYGGLSGITLTNAEKLGAGGGKCDYTLTYKK